MVELSETEELANSNYLISGLDLWLVLFPLEVRGHHTGEISTHVLINPVRDFFWLLRGALFNILNDVSGVIFTPLLNPPIISKNDSPFCLSNPHSHFTAPNHEFFSQ